MKLLLLRHCERFPSPLFFTTLTKKGFEDADKLVEDLPQNIDIIYCSPFLRTLQTIYPYCQKYKKLVFVEYALYELCDSSEFTYNNYLHRVGDFDFTWSYIKDIVDSGYLPNVFSSNIKQIEKNIDITNRVFPFIYNLLHAYKNTDATVLIVTHETICNAIKKSFNRFVNLNDSFEMGNYETFNIDENWRGHDGFY